MCGGLRGQSVPVEQNGEDPVHSARSGFLTVARVTLLARCDFQGSLRYFSKQSVELMEK